MAKPYSRDLRERMVRAVQAGRSRHEVARIFEVSASCVIKLMRRYETTGDCAPGKFGGHKRSALPSNAGLMSRPLAPIGAQCNQASILEGWSLSTRPGLRPT